MKNKFNRIEYAYFLSNVFLSIGALITLYSISDFYENLAATVGAALVFVFTCASFCLGWVMLIHSKETIAENIRIAEQSKVAAAEANLKAAKLLKEISWRRLNALSKQTLYDIMAAVPTNKRKSIYLVFIANNPEVYLFQQDIRTVLADAGFKTTFRQVEGATVGTWVSDLNDPTNNAIIEAFNGISVDFQCRNFDDEFGDQREPTIFIGSKLPAQEIFYPD